jgi:Family of unknown function (DUF6481)
MTSYKAPTLAERQAAAALARQNALDKLKNRAPVDPAIVAARLEAAAKKEAAAAEKRAARLEAIEQARAAKALAASLVPPAPPPPTERSEAEKKAERDRRYAERKARR